MSGPEPAGAIAAGAVVAGAVVDGVDVDAVQAAVSGCRGVARVGSGSVAALATYLPGRRVVGVRVNPVSVEVDVVAEWEAAAGDIGRDVRLAVARLVGGRRVDVTIADIELPGESSAEVVGASERAALPAAFVDSSVVVGPSVVVPPGG